MQFVSGQVFRPYKVFLRVSILPDCIRRNRELSQSEKVLWSSLARFQGKQGDAFPSVDVLAEDIGVERRQTVNILKSLEEKGFLKRIPRSGRSTVYEFLWHSSFEGEPRQYIAYPRAGECPPPMQDNASKETKKENQRKETTKKKTSRRVSFSDLSEEEQRYIELKTAFEASRGKIHSSAAAFRAGLVKKALQGELDIFGLKDLKAWKKNQGRAFLPPPEVRIRSTDKEEMRQATIERVKRFVQEDERSPKELCGLIKKQGKARLPKGVWGLSYQSVAMGLKELHPEYW